MAEQITLEVTAELDGERADKAIAALLGLSRSRALAVAEDGLTIDGVAADPSQRVEAGQIINCSRPGETLLLHPEPVQFGVVYEDDYVVVVDKPAGVVVHPGSGQRTGTLAAGLLDRYPDLAGVGAEDRWGLVHRLDKDTSGLMLVARDQNAFENLVDQLRRRDVGRGYLALVEGRLASPTCTIEATIGRDPARPTRRAVSHSGKFARTHYEVVETFDISEATLVSVTLETGRTHQIRVHMAAIGHPVVGDLTYGATRKDLAGPRMFLHAAHLEFTHPMTAERIEMQSPLPSDLTTVLQRLS